MLASTMAHPFFCEFCNSVYSTEYRLRAHQYMKSTCRAQLESMTATLVSRRPQAVTPATRWSPYPPPSVSSVPVADDVSFTEDMPFEGEPLRPDNNAPIVSTTPNSAATLGPNVDVAGIPSKPHIVEYPKRSGLQAGHVYAKGPTPQESEHTCRSKDGASTWAPFADEEEWELAKWLFNSGLSQRAIDGFLKLPLVSQVESIRVSELLTSRN